MWVCNRWVCNNLDDKGKWVGSHHAKQEDDTATGDQPAGSISRKCKVKQFKSELIEKRFKGQ
jgi:hypothetical protein